MIHTVAAQKKQFTRCEIAVADAAQALYQHIGRPDESEFVSILSKSLSQNCPVIPNDAWQAVSIYSPDIAVVKGKTTRAGAAPRTPNFDAVPIPAPILVHHQNIVLCVDNFFVQGIPFHPTISRNIGFCTVSPIPNWNMATILHETLTAVNHYHAHRLCVHDVHANT